ncbi:ultraviolet-B receptor UVR8-like [Elaeis guineensis]|uniref:ultraviolet-B receptor UVR8-like n=1 Tax=Elaeis guineensis var. tenera TaxID=51953 RepID=UPI00094F5A38
MIEVLSMDGSACKQMESSQVDSLSGKVWVSPSERYAIVPDETVTKQAANPVRGNGNDASVPEKDVKRIRLQLVFVPFPIYFAWRFNMFLLQETDAFVLSK